MDAVHIEKASKPHSSEGAQLFLSTMGEFGVYIFGFGKKARAISALEKFFSLKKNRFSHTNTLFAYWGKNPAGLLMFYDHTNYLRATVATVCQLLKVYTPKEAFSYIKRVFPYRKDEVISRDEIYIAHLAVFPEYRRRGIATYLLKKAYNEALEQRKSDLSLQVEMGNTPAISLYQKFGFEIVEEHIHPEQELSTGSAGDYKMIKKIRQEKK